MKFIIENLETEIIFNKNLLTELDQDENNVYIIDVKVFELFNATLSLIKDHSRIFKLEANEQNKNLDTLQKIYKFLQANNVNRSNLIIGIGGGVTTDITAFASATYKRGCRLILVPTTLLGMVDAAVGGKTGVNFDSIKNGIGCFYPAKKVIIDTDYLETQPKADYRDGFVEIVKMSFLPHSNLAEMLCDEQNIERMIQEAIRTKMELCQQDLHDRSSRRLLNLGHTFGHVLESISNYKIPHGTAVAIGIRAAVRFSLQKGFIESSVCEQIEKKLDLFDLPASFPSKYLFQLLENGTSILKQDKKADQKINLVLFKDLQELFVYKTDNSTDVINILHEFADA